MDNKKTLKPLKGLVVAGALSTAMITSAQAAEGASGTGLNLATELAKMNVTGDINTAIVFVLGVALVLFAGKKVIGFFQGR